MKRVLIVSELFHPQNAIGALRPTKIREALIKRGYSVDVITKSFSDIKDRDDYGTIWRIDAVRPSENINPQKVSQSKNRLIIELKRAKRTLLSLMRGSTYCRHVLRFMETRGIVLSDYDAVITTFGPISSVLIGLSLKKRCAKINWICDFRDPIVVQEVSVFMRPIMALIQRKACRKADHVVTVSNGYLRRICGNKITEKCHMIPNGYDTTDSTVSKTCKQSADVFHLTYVGALYEGRRKITPLFRAMRELASEGKMDLSKVCFDYAGNSGAYLLHQAEEYGLSPIIINHGVLSREKCLQLQFSSHILVLSTWNHRGEEGVFPGKFLEYMLIGRPIISLTDGNIPNGEVTSVIREGNLGVAYESACDSNDFLKLKSYINDCYSEWQRFGNITFEPKQSVLDRYNYNNIVEKFEEMIYGNK